MTALEQVLDLPVPITECGGALCSSLPRRRDRTQLEASLTSIDVPSDPLCPRSSRHGSIGSFLPPDQPQHTRFKVQVRYRKAVPSNLFFPPS
jgi:hypothetical protein